MPSDCSTASTPCCRPATRARLEGRRRLPLAQGRQRQWLAATGRAAAPIRLADLHDIDDQKARAVANTRQFVAGQPANNMLLTGTRGCGKSSLVKALLNEFARKGLRLIEVDKATWSTCRTSSTCRRAP